MHAKMAKAWNAGGTAEEKFSSFVPGWDEGFFVWQFN
jgi:hypothetical protein